MHRRPSFFIVCVLAWLTAPAVYAQSSNLFFTGGKSASNCRCAGCRDFLSGCDTKCSHGKDDKGYLADEGMAAAAEPGMGDFDLLASNLGAAPGGFSAAPGMIGDLLGQGQTFDIHGTSVPIAGGDRRFKVSDNMSPIPTDRLFFNYHHFDGGLGQADGTRGNLDRYVFGLEKTFSDGLWSLELRLPYASGLDADQQVFDTNYGSEFGNITLVGKAFLWQNSCAAITAGCAATLPTASDARLFSGSLELLSVENNAVYFQPFLGWYYAPSSRLFVEGFVASDFDSKGNAVMASGRRVGVLQEQNLLYGDISAGYWLYQNPCANYLQGIAPMIELHYATSMNDSDFVAGIGNYANRTDVFNITGALLFQLTDLSSLRVAGMAPLKETPDRSFDAEVGVQWIRRF